MKPKIQSLLKQIKSGNLKNNNARVLSYVGAHDRCHIDTMRNDLKIAHQTLTSRVSDLEDMGLIYVEGVTSVKGVCYSLYRYENNPVKRESRAKARKLLKFNAWKKRGLTEFAVLLSNDKSLPKLDLKGSQKKLKL